MRLVILSGGRWSAASPERALYEHFAARLKPVAPKLGWGALELVEIAAGKPLLPPKEGKSIALDPRGQALTSEAFAALLRGLRGDHPPALTFLIGGAEGLSDGARKSADLVLSFGSLTYPHLLMRALLAEQLYRAATILTDHPYHRG